MSKLLKLQEIATNKNGELISLNGKICTLRCSNNHEWNATCNNVIHNNTWCMLCSGKKKHNFESLQKLANKYNGICLLNGPYLGNKSKILWRCEKGHDFFACANSIATDRWCPVAECLMERKIATHKERYGVDFPSQDPAIALKTAIKQTNKYIKKHWKTGADLVCQGSYEAKVVDWLAINQIDFLWQPQSFKLSTGKCYIPDMYLVNEDKWVEIKGWLREDSKQKWDEFQVLMPNSEMWNKEYLKKAKII